MATQNYARGSVDEDRDERSSLLGHEREENRAGRRHQPWYRRAFLALSDALRPLSEPEKLNTTERLLLGIAIVLLLVSTAFSLLRGVSSYRSSPVVPSFHSVGCHLRGPFRWSTITTQR